MSWQDFSVWCPIKLRGKAWEYIYNSSCAGSDQKSTLPSAVGTGGTCSYSPAEFTPVQQYLRWGLSGPEEMLEGFDVKLGCCLLVSTASFTKEFCSLAASSMESLEASLSLLVLENSLLCLGKIYLTWYLVVKFENLLILLLNFVPVLIFGSNFTSQFVELSWQNPYSSLSQKCIRHGFVCICQA